MFLIWDFNFFRSLSGILNFRLKSLMCSLSFKSKSTCKAYLKPQEVPSLSKQFINLNSIFTFSLFKCQCPVKYFFQKMLYIKWCIYYSRTTSLVSILQNFILDFHPTLVYPILAYQVSRIFFDRPPLIIQLYSLIRSRPLRKNCDWEKNEHI